VIQNDINNEFSESTIVALMTSHQFPRHYPTHVEVPASESGLKESSTVLLEQVMTVAIERLGQPAGHLPSGTMLEVDRALHFALGLLNCSTTD
jgi:mRNA-degrading endonuclease toxin of MazEF toxin-antitoxin module